MSKRGLYTLIGFLLFIIGTLALLIELVGVHFGLLSFLDYLGRMGSFLAKIFMILGGIVLVVLANDNENARDEFL